MDMPGIRGIDRYFIERFTGLSDLLQLPVIHAEQLEFCPGGFEQCAVGRIVVQDE
jgi:hypothetical protein